MNMRTPLGKVRGYGSARSGTQHFWQQRLTAVALVPLTLWFVWAVVRYTGAPYTDVVAFLSHPISGVAMLMFVLTGIFHMLLGLKVVIEDYIHSEGSKVALLLLSNFAALAIAATCVVAVFRIVV
ncbi:MAG: succinate dehydrogenase, hydrophobic membrane anchor protein [Micropepsaceae bacterium]